MPLRLLAVVALLAAVLIAHGPSLRGGFLWDDLELAVDNPALHGADGPARIWSGRAGPEYGPLTQLLWRDELRLFGHEPFGWRAVNLALHAAAALLLWALLARLRLAGAYLAAVAWALHPLTVASTGWVAETKNTLCQVFACLATWSWLAWRERATRRGPTALLAAATASAFAACLLAKPTLVGLPLVLLLLGWWRSGTLPARELRAAAPLLLLSLVAGLMTIKVQYAHALGAGVLEGTPALERLLLSARAAWFYAGKALLPVGLSAIYPRWIVDPAQPLAWLPLLSLLALSALAWRVRAGVGRALLAAAGAFVLLLAPILGLVPKAYDAIAPVADHFAYAALVVPVAAVAALVAARVRAARPSTRAALATLPLLALGLASYQRAGLSREPAALFGDVLRRHPDAWMAHHLVGTLQARAGELAAAETHLRRAAELHGAFPDAHAALAAVLLDANRLDEAEQELRRALELEPGHAEARATRARLLLQRGDAPAARAELEALVTGAPNDADLLNLLGVALAAAGDAGAEPVLRRALALRPDFPEALNNLARLLATRSTPESRDEARRLLLEALRLKPDYATARENLRALEAAGPTPPAAPRSAPPGPP
jgi:Flp pilus assembly protein TadD